MGILMAVAATGSTYNTQSLSLQSHVVSGILLGVAVTEELPVPSVQVESSLVLDPYAVSRERCRECQVSFFSDGHDDV